MAIDVKSKLCGSRETRIGSITGYSGTLQDIGCFSQAAAYASGCGL
jgi:hypothetical protein